MAPYHQILTLILIGLLSSLLSPCAYAMPSPSYQRRSSLNVEVVDRLELRDGPTFPEQPPSCPICEQNYESIDSCALAAPVLANFTMIIFNPGAFINIIECACTDTFQAAYPQCVDCFIQTNQTQYLDPTNGGQELPAIVTGMRQICAIESTLLGNVSYTDNETTPTPSAPAAASTSGTLPRQFSLSLLLLAILVGAGISF